jgi:hypothetical protein
MLRHAVEKEVDNVSAPGLVIFARSKDAPLLTSLLFAQQFITEEK